MIHSLLVFDDALNGPRLQGYRILLNLNDLNVSQSRRPSSVTDPTNANIEFTTNFGFSVPTDTQNYELDSFRECGRTDHDQDESSEDISRGRNKGDAEDGEPMSSLHGYARIRTPNAPS
jgi:hypothetical protein